MSESVKRRRRIQRPPRPTYDNNGRAIGPAFVYTYDDDGVLVSADPEEAK